jgi:hypothetical protein
MPQTPHIEKHFTASETVRDIVIGMSDGLTVPFALAAGLSGAMNSTALIITAGLAEVAAGAIACDCDGGVSLAPVFSGAAYLGTNGHAHGLLVLLVSLALVVALPALIPDLNSGYCPRL